VNGDNHIMKTLTDELPDLDTILDDYKYQSNLQSYKDFISSKAETTPIYFDKEDLHPETAAVIVSNTIAEFINVLNMVPQMQGRTTRDDYLRNTYQSSINQMIAFRELLVDAAYDTPNEMEELINDRQHRHRIKFFSDKESED